jgi:hypothetical protein
MKNGVEPVDRLDMVRRLDRTDGNSVTYLSRNFSSRLKI